MFKAEMFDPDQWANIFKKAGAQCKSICHLASADLLIGIR